MAIYTLENTIQKYDWGSSDDLPRLLGRDNPDGEPWAELWMGAHPKAPSIAIDPTDGTRVSLDRLIAGDTIGTLGAATAERFGGNLPFLFKILAAASPLSIQSHPTKRKAEHGFAREEFLGIPLDAPERSYKDPNHKPETVVALTEFEGMCGFRPVDDIIDNIKALSPDDWRFFARRLADDPGKLELSVLFYTVISNSKNERQKRLSLARKRGARIISDEPPDSPRSRTFSWILKLMDFYPDDMGALAPLVLNLFRLEPGQALNLSAGQAHAYLHGAAAEIMANSDNVLRGGLTTKHVDIPEFISTLNFESSAVKPLGATGRKGNFLSYPGEAPDYSLARADVSGRLSVANRPTTPEILLCTAGSLELLGSGGQRVGLPCGASAFVSASETGYSLAGTGSVFRAGVPS